MGTCSVQNVQWITPEAVMIRPLRDTDIPQLRELYDRQAFTYPWPDFSQPQFVAKLAAIEDGKVIGAIMARQTVELYCLMDKDHRSPWYRFMIFQRLHEYMRQLLRAKGYRDAHCWIPPNLEKSFARRLIKGFGWNRNPWLCLSRTTEKKG